MGIVAYSPTLLMAESHILSYKIYILKDPRDNKIFYVGQTFNSLSDRLNGHIFMSNSNKEKVEFIKEILLAGMKPIIEEVETIHTKCYIDRILVNERENYWIRHYKGIGCKLFNIVMPNTAEYEGYLSCIKRGETKWHYYYCGKTVGGLDVYDEKRLVADGFKLPDKPIDVHYEFEPIVLKYNPWKNERFLAKIGYRRSPDDKLFYVPCYNDENPDFYDDDY